MSEREQWLKINHFYEDNDGVKHRTWLTLKFQEPHLRKGWPRDGAVYLAIGEDKDLKGSFKLSPNEVTRMMCNFGILVEDHERKLAALYADRYRNRKSEHKESAPSPPKKDTTTDASTGLTEEQKLALDYRTGPLAQAILKECDVDGGLDKPTLLQRLILQGFSRDKIEVIVDLLIKDVHLVPKGDRLKAKV